MNLNPIFILLIFLLFLILFINNAFFFNHKENYVKYNPDAWNKDPYIQYSHNCYQYALDDIDKDLRNRCYHNIKKKFKTCGNLRSRPGHTTKKSIYSGKKISQNCNIMDKGILEDNKNIYKIDEKNSCKKDYYKIAVAIKPGETYHFWRKDGNGSWSHKDAGNKVSDKDYNGKRIVDPKYSNRGKYSKFCNYYCVPENYKSKTKLNRY